MIEIINAVKFGFILRLYHMKIQKILNTLQKSQSANFVENIWKKISLYWDRIVRKRKFEIFICDKVGLSARQF